MARRDAVYFTYHTRILFSSFAEKKAAEESEKFAQKIILEKEGERVRMKKEFDKLVS